MNSSSPDSKSTLRPQWAAFRRSQRDLDAGVIADAVAREQTASSMRTPRTLRRLEPPRATPAFDAGLDPTTDLRWQRLWLATQTTDWRSLVVVPAAADFNTFRTAQALAAVGWRHLGTPVDAFDATVLNLEGLASGLENLARRGALGRRTIVALPSVLVNPIALQIARAVDATLVCVRLGDRLEEAQRTIDEVGVERVLGTSLVRARGAH